MKFVLVFCCVLSSILAVELPSYIKPCSLKDPNLSDCIKNEANNAISIVIKGEPLLAVPVLSPLTLPQLDIGGDNLQIKLTNVWNDDLKNLRFRETILDLANQKAGFVGITDTITILATYSIQNGKIRSRTVSGSGGFNMTLSGVIIDYRCGATVQVRDGVQYLHATDPTIETEIERAYYKFENLQSPSGDSIDEYIDKNWRWLKVELKPSMDRFFLNLFNSTVSGVISHVPISKLFQM